MMSLPSPSGSILSSRIDVAHPTQVKSVVSALLSSFIPGQLETRFKFQQASPFARIFLQVSGIPENLAVHIGPLSFLVSSLASNYSGGRKPVCPVFDTCVLHQTTEPSVFIQKPVYVQR